MWSATIYCFPGGEGTVASDGLPYSIGAALTEPLAEQALVSPTPAPLILCTHLTGSVQCAPTNASQEWGRALFSQTGV